MTTASLIIGTNEDNFESSKLNYIEAHECFDKSKRSLFIAGLCYDRNNFYIQTEHLTVLEFNPEMKYIKVELDERTQNLFDKIDDRGKELFDDLINNEEYTDLFDEIKDKELDQSSLYIHDSVSHKNYFKIRLNEVNKINLNKKKININDFFNYSFSTEDEIRFLIEIKYLTLYKNNYKCGIKYFCRNIEINTPIDVSKYKTFHIGIKFTPSKICLPIMEDIEATEVSPKDNFDNTQTNNEDNTQTNNEDNIQTNNEDNMQTNNEDNTQTNNEDNTQTNNEDNIQTTTDTIFISTSNKKSKSRAPPKSKITTETITTTTTKPAPKKKAPIKNK
jgi:hypothetical protein